VDLVLKRALYEQAGVASYWVVDPEAPSIAVWDLTGRGYGEPRTVTGDDGLTVDLPYPLSIVPSALQT